MKARGTASITARAALSRPSPTGGTTYTWDNFGRQFFVYWWELCHNHEAPAEGVPPGLVFDDEAYVRSLAVGRR